MAIILSIESSSDVCSVCVHQDGKVLSISETKEAFSHTRKMTLFIQEVLNHAGMTIKDLQAVAVSHGPGSYTGLRVAAATAKGLCYGLGLPLIAVDTLQAIALEASRTIPDALYIPMIDARRMEVYYAIYDDALNIIRQTDSIILEEGIFDEAQPTNGLKVLCGTGIAKATLLFQDSIYHQIPMELSAGMMVEIAEEQFNKELFENIVSYEPNYFKAPKVTKSKKQPF